MQQLSFLSKNGEGCQNFTLWIFTKRMINKENDKQRE